MGKTRSIILLLSPLVGFFFLVWIGKLKGGIIWVAFLIVAIITIGIGAILGPTSENVSKKQKTSGS